MCLSAAAATTPANLSGSGIDAMDLGDVNGDRIADVAVASHNAGHTQVTIYSGGGQAAKTSTGFAPLALATFTDPLGVGIGPLDVALGDFNGDGVSELAVSSTANGDPGGTVAVWSFSVEGNSPIDAQVNPVSISTPFDPQGFGTKLGFSVASADIDNDGRDELIVGPAGAAPSSSRHISAFDLSSGTSWKLAKTYQNAPVRMTQGVNFDAGDVTDDGVTDLAVVSQASGRASLYDGSLHRWTWTTRALNAQAGTARVAVVSSEGASGALVVTGQSAKNSALATLFPYKGDSVRFSPATSPGAGALVPLGAGYVYQKSTVTDPTSKFPTSNGPITPTVLFASTGGSQVIVQGFSPKLAPSKADTYVEPLSGGDTAAFWPLQSRRDAATGKSDSLTASEKVPINLIAYPDITYHSPYKIELSQAPKSIYDGLEPYTSISTTSQDGWGPAKVPNIAPTVPADASNDWLRQRVLAVTMSAIGVDYQHHHDPLWQPAQGSEWNITSTVGYQSQGVDCTNFTAWAYSQALGVTINSDTQQQADISPSNPNGTIIPASLSDRVEIQTIDHWSSYDDLVSRLLPGDILIINGNPSDKSVATHGITWLGSYGKDANGKDQNLIIDSTGISPAHVDSSGHVVPEGVHIRPFGAPGTLNDWYFKHVDHVLRLIKDDSTTLVPIAGSTLPNLDGSDPKPVDDSQVVDALISLRRRPDSANQPSLESLALKPISERVYLTRDEFANRYGADPSDIAAVRQWAIGQGLTIDDTDVASRTIRVSGRADDMGQAFGIRVLDGSSSAGAWSYDGAISVPKSLKDVIQGVFSVSSKPEADSTSTTANTSDADEATTETPDYTPPDVARLYDFPDADGTGQTVGVIEFAGVIDAQARADFHTYFQSLNLPDPDITAVGQGTPSTGNEMFLDLETIGAIVPKAKIVAYFGAPTPGDFYQTVQDAIHDPDHKIDVLSLSVAFAEDSLSSMYLDVANQAFLEAAVMGVSVFTSAGDYGSSRDIPDGLAHVEFPSASPWVTSTGGTRLPVGDSIDHETVWDKYKIEDGYLIGDKGSTGGGVSQHFAVPDYQKGVIPDPRSVDPGHASGRGGPDVASLADPSTGIWIRGHGQFLNDGGTSAAAPVWAALAVRLNQGLGKNLGFFNSLLYGPLRDKGVTHDITSGDNTSSHIDLEGNQIPTYLGYDAKPGWDMTTGWGSPKGKALLSEIKKLLK